MSDRDLAPYLDYMRAHIRVQDSRLVAQLSNVQLHDAFHMLPRPMVSFREWLQRTGRVNPATENPEKNNGNDSSVSASLREVNPQADAEIEAQNARGLAALRALQAHGFPVTINAEP